MNEGLALLRRNAREIYFAALSSLDPGDALRRDVSLDGDQLRVAGSDFAPLSRFDRIFSVALGKAAPKMAFALDGLLGERLHAGVLAAPNASLSTPDAPTVIDSSDLASAPWSLSSRWRVFAGGHPSPNEESLAAARAALKMLDGADDPRALVVFLVSGGGSASIEWPRDERVSLAELRAANDALISCGASIAEVNAVRRAFSAVKGGGLAVRARRAAQLTLIVSDTNAGEEHNVASGPTLPPPDGGIGAAEIVARYGLATRLPADVLNAMGKGVASKSDAPGGLRRHHVLLDNRAAVERAAESARARGFVVEAAWDLNEQHVAEGSAALVSRLAGLRRRESAWGRGVCLVSGGEFACPAREAGRGGRNAETVLRCAFEMEGRAADSPGGHLMVCLSAGTDGIDGNSPAAGALADTDTLRRARVRNLDARRHLDASDAYTFFNALGDTVVTGATGTNVRDLRVLLAK